MTTLPEMHESASAERDMSGPRSVMRILGVFEALAMAADGLSLAELSATLGAPKSSLLTLLRPLVGDCYLIHSAGRYRIGARMFRLSADILSIRRFRDIIHPYVEELAAATSETVYFAVLDHQLQVATCIDMVDSVHTIRYAVPVGMTMPLYLTAAGNVLLAYQEKAWQDQYLRSVKFEKLTAATPTSRTALLQVLKEVREAGIAVSIGRWTEESAALAAPVFNADGSLAGVLTLAGPVERLRPKLEQYKKLLKKAAAAASGTP